MMIGYILKIEGLHVLANGMVVCQIHPSLELDNSGWDTVKPGIQNNGIAE